MDRRVTAGAVALTWLVGLWRHGHAACTVPDAVSGTRHNGTLAVYNSGDVLLFSCDTGYNPNYNNPISTCLDSGNWNPANLTCGLDILSLVIAIVVAMVGIIVFILAIVWLQKRRNETDSRRIKRKARQNTYQQYEPKGSRRMNGHANPAMAEEIEMGDRIGMPMGDPSVHGETNGHANGLLWSPPAARGTVTQDEEYAILQRSRKSSGTSRSSRTDNMPPTGPSGVQLNPDYGDVEFGAPNTNMRNFKAIGSTVMTMAQPTMGANTMEMSLPMPDSASPTMTSDENTSPRDSDDVYAAVDMSKKKNRKRMEEEEEKNNNNLDTSNGVTVATIESDGAYSAVGSTGSGSMSAHELALMEQPYSAINNGGDYDDDMGEGDYAVVKRVEEPVKDAQPAEEDDFSDMYATVKK